MKVVLIGQQGSGTNLLRTFLNWHPDIYFADELFVSRRDKTGGYQQSNKNVKQFLDDFYSRKAEKVVGFDLKYNQINKKILNYIKNNKVAVIHLRRDKARTFFKNIQIFDQVFTYQQLMEHCEKVKKKEQEIFNCFHKEQYLEITYEDMARGEKITSLPIDFEKKLLNFLTVEYQKLGLGNFCLSPKCDVRFN